MIAYRDRSADEVRDISIVRRVGGRWTKPAPVHDDGWKIQQYNLTLPIPDELAPDVVSRIREMRPA